ncbi:Actin-7 [Taenia crassiceps]|uniref:Actin-7 n=1 Tax=Taenia crassiceps TaxID=6207 RepID=A0ABR4QTT2_9CEST
MDNVWEGFVTTPSNKTQYVAHEQLYGLLIVVRLQLKINREVVQNGFGVVKCLALHVAIKVMRLLSTSARTAEAELKYAYCCTHTVPIRRGCTIPHAVLRVSTYCTELSGTLKGCANRPLLNTLANRDRIASSSLVCIAVWCGFV